MAEWSDNIAKILRQTDIPKITGALIGHSGDEVGKCALGVISCEVGLPLTLELAMAENLPTYNQILKKAGVPNDYIDGEIPYSTYPESVEYNVSLDRVIWSLNDSLRLSFKEIADYIEITFKDDKDGD